MTEPLKPLKPGVRIAIQLLGMFSVSLMWITNAMHHHPLDYLTSVCCLGVLICAPITISREWKKHRNSSGRH
jgi:hypothetical protein